MKGFDAKFPDLRTYILGMTAEIWEGRGVDSLNHYYTPQIPVRSPDGSVIGNQAVIHATNATLDEFPDRQLLGEDVIWSGNDEDGFLSSHRIFSTATHLGDGSFGPATGKQLRYRVIADCAAINNQIYDEWLVRDLGAIVRQLGYEPRDFAEARIEAEGGPETASMPLLDQHEPPPVYQGTSNTDPVGRRYADALVSLMTDDSVEVAELYDRAVHQELPGGFQGHGWADAETFWAGLRVSFPDAELTLHHVIGRQDDGFAPRAAVRWSLNGTHSGEGSYGPPSGAPVNIMGISHAEYWPLGLRREYVLFDEVAIWKQILLHLARQAD